MLLLIHILWGFTTVLDILVNLCETHQHAGKL